MDKKELQATVPCMYRTNCDNCLLDDWDHCDEYAPEAALCMYYDDGDCEYGGKCVPDGCKNFEDLSKPNCVHCENWLPNACAKGRQRPKLDEANNCPDYERWG